MDDRNFFGTNNRSENKLPDTMDVFRRANMDHNGADPGDMYNNGGSENSIMSEILSWIKTIVIAVIAAYLITRFIIVNAKIPSASMETTIMTGDRLIANRISYYIGAPKRFDIAVFKYPDDESILYIKRVIGLPGDKVEIKSNEIYINDSTEPLEDSFINGSMDTPDALYTVPKEGDSLSEYTQYIKDTDKYDKNGDGLFDEDCYFMMGDNRNNSADSRYWRNTFVPESYVQGKAIFRYFPFNKMGPIKNKFN